MSRKVLLSGDQGWQSRPPLPAPRRQHIRDPTHTLAVNHYPFSPAAEGLRGQFSMVMTTKTKIGSNPKGIIFLRAAKCTRVMRLVKQHAPAGKRCPADQLSGWGSGCCHSCPGWRRVLGSSSHSYQEPLATPQKGI